MASAKGRSWDAIGLATARGPDNVARLEIVFALDMPPDGFPGRHGSPTPGGRELLCVVGRRCAEKCREELSLPGHVCIVTGASGGMGAEVAWGLAEAKSERQQKRKKESYNSEPFFSCPSHGSHFALQAGASRALMACRNA